MSVQFTPAQIVEMVKSGTSIEDIERLMQAGSPVAESASPKAGKETPAFLVKFAQNKAARRSLAAELRAAGVDLTGPKGAARWAKEKKARGIA